MNKLEQFELFLVRGGKRKSSDPTDKTTYSEKRKSSIAVYKKVYKRIERNVGSEFSKEKIDEYIFSLQQKGIKSRSLNMLVNVVRLYGQCFDREDLFEYPYFKRPKYSERVTMTDEEIEAFLSCPPNVRKYKNRWGSISTCIYKDVYDKYTLFYEILAFTGMRPAELAEMTLERIDLTQRIFKLREEDVKTHEPRIVPIPDRSYKKLYDYIKTLHGEYLFPSKNGGKDLNGLPCMNATDWGYNFQQRVKRLGITRKGLSVYSLRHSLITRLLDEDVNLYKVQNLVGHKDIATTAIYYHSSTKALKETIRKDPLSRKSTPEKIVLSQLVSQIEEFLGRDHRFTLSVDRNTEGHIVLDIKYLNLQ